MAGYNGLGTYVRFENWTNDAAAGIKIRADRFDIECDGYAAGLSNAICKDGQTTVTANLPMATFRHTGVGDGAARTDYASLGQLQDSNVGWIAGGGTADAITAAYSPAVTALTDGMILSFRATAANATTTPTFSPNGLTARTIVKNGGAALSVSDIGGALGEYFLRYNLANTRWELLNPAVLANTWVPSIGGTATYTTQVGTYVKQGRAVHIRMTLTINAIGTGSPLAITGLPFPPNATGNHNLYCSYFAGINTAVTCLMPDIASGTSSIIFNATTAAQATATDTVSVFKNGARVEISGFYEV